MKSIKNISMIVLFFVFQTILNSKVLMIDDFDKEEFINKLGGINGVWNNNPYDRTAFSKASFCEEVEGYSLQIDYDIDSMYTYFFSDTYILDYSQYSIIGLSKNLPHTAFNGFYFLLGGIDLTEYNYLVFYAKGDENIGYTRKFQIEIKTPNQYSKYIVDGITNKWKKFVIPLSVFERIDNWKNVTELTIVFNENVTEPKGRIYFDNFCFVTSLKEVPKLKNKEYRILSRQEITPKITPETFLGENISVNYRYTPERGNEIFGSGNLLFEGNYGRFTGRLQVSAFSQEFGKGFYQQPIETYPYFYDVIVPVELGVKTIQLNVENITPLVNRITFGNIHLGYSPYIISPIWGYKGVKITGRKDFFEHSTFLVKRQLNSYTFGNQSVFYLGNHRIKLIGFYDEETAKIKTSGSMTTQLQDFEEIEIRPVAYEYAYLINTLFRLDRNRFNIETNFGYNNYRKVAEADYETDPTEPQYNYEIQERTQKDNMYEIKLFLDGYFKGNKILLSYRDIGESYKPKYRQEPIVFEDVVADQKGYKFQLEQWWRGFGISFMYDDIIRNTSKDYFRKTANISLNYLGPKGSEFKIIAESRTEKYKNVSLNIDRDEEVTSLKAYVLYNFIYPDAPGLRLPLTFKTLLQRDFIYHPKTDKRYTQDSLQLDLDYKLMTDFGFAISYKTTRFGDPSWEPKGYPYTDNYLCVYFNLNF